MLSCQKTTMSPTENGTISTGNNELDTKLEEWLKFNKNDSQNDEVRELIAKNDVSTLSKLFLERMAFGTAGLRGRMGVGFSQMNDLVIIQTAQGLLKYLQREHEDLSTRGIVVGYDGRHNSRRFAELTAAVFEQAGVKVNLFAEVCPTPFVPFAVTHCHHVVGVMVTASHNPKEDNGYKVYGPLGTQIISPVDKEIQKCILDSLEPQISWDVTLSADTLDQTQLTVTQDAYYAVLKAGVYNASANAESPLNVTYTAMHGVGYPYVCRAFEVANFKPVIPVKEQVEPDPEFPTVKFPNPEEGKSALTLAIRTANEHGSTIIVANDPDADRLAVAEKTRQGEWKVFTGNELGALLGWWSLYTYQRRNPNTDLSNVYMISSTVSSKILKTMAKQEKFNFEETLTGFKWMGTRSAELEAQGKTVLYAFEESIGYMCGTGVLDKDGVSAAVRVTELATFLSSNQGLTLHEKLNYIYSFYGYHISENSYFICHEPEVIKKMFERLRNFGDTPNNYPEGLLANKYQVVSVRDLTTGYDSTTPDHKATLPVSKSSQMITFTFNNGLVATLRTSGTEPKIKYYTELCASPQLKDIDEVKAVLKEMVNAIIEEWFQPKLNNLIAKSG
ncbi:phosphopentomutase-like isoform X2 [Macrosteles quadrilineatus]|uniref:phosphopentomutase-like isoform X1 n=1 Tax=Macrosteles quadrilineatus TaxID=74068 RepID=UPI0023E24B0E|nr:phosphopentomutase-like isoform X1 [Macrosteles quadrilineatus]XP_054262220.1 phosphopentomutase-like isoform X2 [Macrosteles quadrilineatus]